MKHALRDASILATVGALIIVLNGGSIGVVGSVAFLLVVFLYALEWSLKEKIEEEAEKTREIIRRDIRG